MSFKSLFYRLYHSGFFFILAVQIIFLFFIQPGFNWESLRYFTGGLNIKVYHPPLYNFFLSALYNTIPSIYAPILIQIIFYSFSASFLIYSLEKYFVRMYSFGSGFSKKIKYILIFIVSFEPLIILDNCTLSTESLFTSFTILNLAFFLFYLTGRKNYFLILTGVSIGLSMATRFIGIIFPFFFIMMLFIFVKRSSVLRPLASIMVPVLIFYFGICSLHYWKNRHFIYSAFGGWHLWNTASPLFTPEIKVEDEKLSKFLHSDYEKYSPEYAWDYYQFDGHSQSIRYMKYLVTNDSMSENDAVYKMNREFKKVGMKLIRNNPLQFCSMLIKGNTKYFFDETRIPERIGFPYTEKKAYISRKEFYALIKHVYGYTHDFKNSLYTFGRNQMAWLVYKISMLLGFALGIILPLVLLFRKINFQLLLLYSGYYFLIHSFCFPINLRFLTPVTGIMFITAIILITKRISSKT